MFGGYNIFGKDTNAVLILNLNPHYELTVTFNLY